MLVVMFVVHVFKASVQYVLLLLLLTFCVVMPSLRARME